MRIRKVQQPTPLLVDKIDDELVAPTRSREELQLMLADAIERRDQWFTYWDKTKLSRKQNVEALRNYTALRGVVKTLQWVLMHPDIEHPLD
tara:strand:- start:393 stop:665 length:273 start_codon:yes stop_codon:yes gene_type:complete